MGKTRQGRLFLRVRHAINAVDPAGLLRAGFPDDEYDPETSAICHRLQSGVPLEEHLVQEVLLDLLGRARAQDVAAIITAFEAADA